MDESLAIDDLGPRSGIKDGTLVALHKIYLSMCMVWKKIRGAKYTEKRVWHSLNN